LRNADDVRPIVVGAWIKAQEVAGRENLQPFKELGSLFTNALDIFNVAGKAKIRFIVNHKRHALEAPHTNNLLKKCLVCLRHTLLVFSNYTMLVDS
jgi:hypothetical protein